GGLGRAGGGRGVAGGVEAWGGAAAPAPVGRTGGLGGVVSPVGGGRGGGACSRRWARPPLRGSPSPPRQPAATASPQKVRVQRRSIRASLRRAAPLTPSPAWFSRPGRPAGRPGCC